MNTYRLTLRFGGSDHPVTIRAASLGLWTDQTGAEVPVYVFYDAAGNWVAEVPVESVLAMDLYV